MKSMTSRIVYGLSWTSILLALLMTLLWFYIAISKDGYAGLAFQFLTPYLSGGSLLLGVIPSAVFYITKRERRDLLSLRLSGVSFVVVLGESMAIRHGLLGGLRLA